MQRLLCFLYSIVLINKLYFFRAVLGLWKNWWESTESSHIPCLLPPPHPSSLNVLHWNDTFVCINIDILLTLTKVPSLQYGSLFPGYLLWVLMNVWWHVSTTTVPYRMVSLPWKSCVFGLFIPPFQPPPKPDLFTLLIVLPFPEYRKVGLRPSVVFQIGFFHSVTGI